MAQWLEHRTRDWTVAGSNPCRSSGRIFIPTVNFLCCLLFRYPFHSRVTAVARKYSGHSAKSASGRLQLNTHAPYVCGFAWSDLWYGTWLYGVHRTRRDGSSFMWRQPCQRCKYTTLVDILKTHYKKLFTHVESHASAVSLLKSGEWHYIKAINNNNNN